MEWVVRIGSEADGDLELDRIGVLELVEQDPLVTAVQVGSNRRVTGDELAGQHEQIVELDGAVGGSGVGGIEHPPSEQRSEHPDPIVANRLQQRQRLIGELDLVLAQIVQRLRIEPGRFPVCLRPGSLDLATSILEVLQDPDLLAEPVCLAELLCCKAQLGQAGRLGVVGRAGCVADIEHGPGERCRVELPGGRIGAVDSGLDEVPVVVEPGGDPAGARGQAEIVEPAQLDQPAPTLDDPAGRVRIVEDLVEQRAPALLEGELALELVEHPESGRQTGLHGIVVQDPSGEGVQRADRGVVEGVEREVHPLGVDRVVSVGLRRGQLGAQAVAQLGGGLLGERDGGDRADLDTARHERRRSDRPSCWSCPTRPPPRRTDWCRDRSAIASRSARSGSVSCSLTTRRRALVELSGLVLREPRGKTRIELLQLPFAESLGDAEPVGLAVVAIDAELPLRDAWSGGEEAGFDALRRDAPRSSATRRQTVSSNEYP